MAIYEHASGERRRPIAGSSEDRRLANSAEWRAVAEKSVDPERPNESALKDAWMDYALAVGVPSFEVHNMTKDELIERCGDG